MGEILLGVLLAATASICFNVAIVFQAFEARKESTEHGLHLSLIAALIRRPRWLAASLLAAAAVPLQVAALLFAPITIVQPADATGLVVLLIVGARYLHERVQLRDCLAVGAIVLGVAGLALAAPERSDDHAGGLALAIALGPLALLAVAPIVLRRRQPPTGAIVLSSALAFACGAFGLKLIADSLSSSDWAALAIWVPFVVVLGLIGVTSEQTALQLRPVARVAPIIFAVELAVPVALAPLVGGESWPSDPGKLVLLIASFGATFAGAMLLERSPQVAGMLTAGKGHDEQLELEDQPPP